MSTVAHAPARAGAYLRALDPQLTRPAWILELAMGVNTLGNGLVLPFLVIYLHGVRGIGLATAGLALALYGATGLVAATAAGPLVDRLGARAVLAGSCTLAAAGYALLPAVRSPWHAFAVLGLAGIGNGAFWPASSALLVAHTDERRRHTAFAVNRLAANVGLGVGALVGGVVASVAHPGSFTVLFGADAATFLVFAVVLALLPPGAAAPRRSGGGRYADVLRNRPFVAVVVLNTLLVTVGFAQLEAMLPVFARESAGLGEQAIGLLFGLNVAIVVVAQLPAARALAGRRRLPALAFMAVAWAGAWLLVLVSDVGGGTLAALVLATAVGIFSLAECVQAPTMSGLVADLAEPALRGRYFGLSTSSYALGFALGPAAGGALLALSADALWAVAAGACLLVAAGSVALERHLPEAVVRAPA